MAVAATRMQDLVAALALHEMFMEVEEPADKNINPTQKEMNTSLDRLQYLSRAAPLEK